MPESNGITFIIFSHLHILCCSILRFFLHGPSKYKYFFKQIYFPAPIHMIRKNTNNPSQSGV